MSRRHRGNVHTRFYKFVPFTLLVVGGLYVFLDPVLSLNEVSLLAILGVLAVAAGVLDMVFRVVTWLHQEEQTLSENASNSTKS